MSLDRHLEWEGCFNVRDLGGLPTRDGSRTRRGAIVRADGLDRLSERGWASAVSHGIRTIVDLRNDDELGHDASPRPKNLTTVRVPIDDTSDRDLWEHISANELDGSPLYYRLFLEQKAEQCVGALRAVAHARPGGIVFHCGRGRDRTGLLALLILAVVGADPNDIVSDYELSTERVKLLDAALGEPDQGSEIAAILKRKNTNIESLLTDLLQSGAVEKALSEGGFGPEDEAALRARFLESA